LSGRALWLRFTASDLIVEKLTAELTAVSVQKANNSDLSAAKMLENLEGKIPSHLFRQLQEIKDYSYRHLSSFIHGGIHVISAQRKGHHKAVIQQVVKMSNAMAIMGAQLQIIISGDPAHKGKLPQIQMLFHDCLPPHHKPTTQGAKGCATC